MDRKRKSHAVLLQNGNVVGICYTTAPNGRHFARAYQRVCYPDGYQHLELKDVTVSRDKRHRLHGIGSTTQNYKLDWSGDREN